MTVLTFSYYRVCDKMELLELDKGEQNVSFHRNVGMLSILCAFHILTIPELTDGFNVAYKNCSFQEFEFEA